VNDAGSVIDLSSLRQVRATATDVTNVWRISLPLQPWKFSDAEQERQSIVGKLSSAFPYRALWLSDWASYDRPGWRLLARDEMLSLLDDELSKGAWVLFFFEHDPGAIFDALIPAEPGDAADAARIIRDLGVAAAIWSWYDDNEWLVVLPGTKPGTWGSRNPPSGKPA
jgi:hypothetical protein